MEITNVQFFADVDFGVWILHYNYNKNTYDFVFESTILIETLIDCGFIKSSDGTLVTIPVLTTADEYHEETYTLEEFLPMMSNTSWKDVATYIENSKK